MTTMKTIKRNRRLAWWLAVYAGLSWGAVCQAGEGFGFAKQVVELGRVLPPEISLPGNRIHVKTIGEGKGDESEKQLLAMIESSTLTNAPTLVLDPVNPQGVIEAAVLQKERVDTWETRKKVTVIENGKDAKGIIQFRPVEVMVKYRIVKMVLGISFRIIDGRNQRVLLADQVSRTHDQAYENGAGAPEGDWLENQLMADAAAAVAARITPTIEKVGVLVPKGSMKDYVNFAVAGLWDRYLEGIERMPTRPNSRDESYRQYALGLAHEALAYGAQDSEIALRYLEQASVYYNAALVGNPKEENFVSAYQSSTFLKDLGVRVLEPLGAPQVRFQPKTAMAPVERVRTALTQYQKWSEMQSVASSKDLSAEGGPGSATPQAIFDNQSVIELSRARLSEDIIMKAIDDAPNPSFDLSTQGLIQLSQAKVSEKIIRRLQALASPGPGRSNS